MTQCVVVELPSLWEPGLEARLRQIEEIFAGASGMVLLCQPDLRDAQTFKHRFWRRDLYRSMFWFVRLAEMVHQDPGRFAYLGTGVRCPHFYAALARQCRFLFWKKSFVEVRVSSSVSLRDLVLEPSRLPLAEVKRHPLQHLQFPYILAVRFQLYCVNAALQSIRVGAIDYQRRQRVP